jgi:hypothetical protein
MPMDGAIDGDYNAGARFDLLRKTLGNSKRSLHARVVVENVSRTLFARRAR